MLTREKTNYDVFDEENEQHGQNEQNEKYESIDLHNKNQPHIHNQLNAELNGIAINHYCCYFLVFNSVLCMVLIIYYLFY